VGIYDRDYYRETQRSGFASHLPSTIVVTLIVINVAVWIVDQFTPEVVNFRGEVVGRWLSSWLAASPRTFTQPWLWWQFLTAGFTHAPANVGPGIWHIAGNMLVLFMLGRAVEDRYGPREFLRIYLVTLVFANVAWCLVTLLTFGLNGPGIYGASGAIAGIVVLFAFNFPNVTILFFFVIPMPAWVFGMLVVLLDIYGAVKGGSEVAYVAHLGGAGFCALYYLRGWNLTRLTGGLPVDLKSLFRRKPRLRVHKPDDEPPHPDFSAEVDRILEKIYREGESSLTAKERQTLEQASREYQRKGAGNGGRGNPPSSKS
jgi:membrane associated rhomboid family serine protease